MIAIDDKVWVGDSDDGHLADNDEISAVLNTAQDLSGRLCWPQVEYSQVGLVDGPGNEVVNYCSAILALVSLTRRHDAILVYDHNGSRALAVGVMYLSLTEGKVMERVDFLRRRCWDELIHSLEEAYKAPLPVKAHIAHIKAFNKIPFSVLEALL